MGRCLNCIHYDVCDTDRHEKERLYGDCSDFLNDADVVPKSELELYMRLYHEVEEELASTYNKLENAKSEVAKIFEEIETIIDPYTDEYGTMLTLEEDDFAELRKKYMED